MIIINKQEFLPETVLFTFALASEAADVFRNCNTLITGIGKVNAAYELTKRIHTQRPSLIVNLGSAGSRFFEKGTVVCCTRFIQRDMDVRGLGYAHFETPLSGIPPVLDYGIGLEGLPLGTCGTGDLFETGLSQQPYDVVDMEAYALALTAFKEGIPFLCLKYISDGADDTAAEDWTVQVHRAAAAYGKLFGLVQAVQHNICEAANTGTGF